MDKQISTRRLEGVFVRGYGVVPKSVMLLAALTPEAKALYAYYCVMSGNDGGFQPSAPEAVILQTMGMSHARFIKHRKTLSDMGLIRFEQGRRSIACGKQLFETSRFCIVKAPREPEQWQHASMQALAALQEGVFCDGFGLVPRMVLLDRTLSIEAKAAYVFLCVYANASTRDARTATPSAELLSDRLMGRKRVQRAMRELEDAGYIRRERMHTGVFGGFCYVLLFDKQEAKIDTTETFEQEVKNDTAERAPAPPRKTAQPLNLSKQETRKAEALQQAQNETAETSAPAARFETAENETAENETAEIDTATLMNTKGTNTKAASTVEKFSKDGSFIRQVSSAQRTRRTGPTGRWRSDEEFFSDMLQKAGRQIEADVLKEEYGAEIIDAVVHLMADFYCARSGTVNINGRPYPVPGVAKVFRELRAAHVEQVVQALREYGENVGNLQAYLTACLYNAPVTYGTLRFREDSRYR